MNTRGVLLTCLLTVGVCGAGQAQPTAQERAAEAMLARVAGAHLTWDPQTDRVKRVGLVNVGPMNLALGWAAALPAATELEVVALPWQDFDDRGLRALAGMTQLRELQVVGPRITERGVAALAGLTNLEQLAIDAPIADAALRHLAGLSQLRLLDLYGTRVTGEGLGELAGLTQLEFLNLDRTPLSGAGLAAVAQLPHLRILLLRGVSITDEGAGRLAELSSLEQLYLDGARITDRGAAALAGVLDPHLMTFAGPGQLRVLSLREAPHLRGDRLADVANLYGLPYLQRLDLSHTPLGRDQARLERLRQAEQTVEHWRTLPTVRSVGPIVRFDENLDLYGLYFVEPSFPISREALDELYNYPPATLQELSLRGAVLRQATTREPSDVEKLTRLSNLRKLNLYGTNVTNDALRALQTLANLRLLVLSEDNAQATSEGAQALQNAIPELEIVRLP